MVNCQKRQGTTRQRPAVYSLHSPMPSFEHAQNTIIHQSKKGGILTFKKIFWSITIIIIVIDQTAKYIINALQPNTFFLRTVHNTGAGFGILQNQTFMLGILSALVAIAVIFFYRKIPQEKWPQVLWALFLGGVIGNLIDRIFRGYVIDFIEVGFWPAFNIADAAISIAAIGLIIYFWKR